MLKSHCCQNMKTCHQMRNFNTHLEAQMVGTKQNPVKVLKFIVKVILVFLRVLNLLLILQAPFYRKNTSAEAEAGDLFYFILQIIFSIIFLFFINSSRPTKTFFRNIFLKIFRNYIRIPEVWPRQSYIHIWLNIHLYMGAPLLFCSYFHKMCL